MSQDATVSVPSPYAASPLRRLRNAIVLAAMIVAAVDLMGVPHVRATSRYAGSSANPIYLDADYWSVTGWRHAAAGRYGDGCPAIAWIPLDKPLHRRGLEAVAGWIKPGTDALSSLWGVVRARYDEWRSTPSK